MKKALLIAGVSILIAVVTVCGYKVHTLSMEQQRIKQDYSTVNDITFGILSVSQWRDKIILIVNDRIQNFEFTKEEKADLQKEVEQLLNTLVDKALNYMEKPQKTLGGKIKKLAFKTFVNTDDLHKQVPDFAAKIIAEVEKPQSKERLVNIAQAELQKMSQDTYDSSEGAQNKVIDSVLNVYHVPDLAAFDNKAHITLQQLKQTMYHYVFGMLISVLLILFIWWLLRKKTELHSTLYILSIISAVVLLLTGLTTTMIEIDARIKTLNFHLLGQDITFNNQVLFFQSKSIVDVVDILLKTGKYDSIIVGVLILCFSILFPVTKLFSAGIYLLSNKKWTKSRFVEYFAFKSGKWSMADVMVIAILMTYIGFNGILESQLSGLNIHDETLTSIATNNTSLQPGYIVFTGFVIYGLILSEILKRVTKHE